MNKEIKQIIYTSQYNFLADNEHLGDNICLIALGGSHAYGTNVKDSDIDIRGCTLNRKQDILTNISFEQYVDSSTDTTIYGFNKLINLLSNVNPNTIELLGCRPQDYLYVNSVGQELIDNANLFLSKKAVHSFGGYANQQLRRLENMAIRDTNELQKKQHIINTIKNIKYYLDDKYTGYKDDQLKVYLDNDAEIYIDVNLTRYPLQDYVGLWGELQQIVKSYNKLGSRNSKAIEHNKIAKHMMHLVRLYYMCFDILENEKIITYRDKEHDLLMSIRNGKYLLDDSNNINKEFFELVNSLDERMEYAKKHTCLREVPQYDKINEFMYSVNERVVNNAI